MYPSPVRVYRYCDSVCHVFSHLSDIQHNCDTVCMDFTDAETEYMYRHCDSVYPVFSHLSDIQHNCDTVCMDFTDAEYVQTL